MREVERFFHERTRHRPSREMMEALAEVRPWTLEQVERTHGRSRMDFFLTARSIDPAFADPLAGSQPNRPGVPGTVNSEAGQVLVHTAGGRSDPEHLPALAGHAENALTAGHRNGEDDDRIVGGPAG